MANLPMIEILAVAFVVFGLAYKIVTKREERKKQKFEDKMIAFNNRYPHNNGAKQRW